ncbi:MAG: hypothetical protein K2Q20_15065 [Phycisphaerales bacterium]|nr:hypothetical protein [Phycisphaerales bacterium]
MSRHTTRLLSRLFRPSQWSDAAFGWVAAAALVAVILAIAGAATGLIQVIVFAVRAVLS